MARYVKIEEILGTNVVSDISLTTKDGYEEAPDSTLMYMEKAGDGSYSKGKVYRQVFSSDNPRRKFYPSKSEFFGLYVDGIVKANTAQQQLYIDKCNWVKKCIPLQGIQEEEGDPGDDL